MNVQHCNIWKMIVVAEEIALQPCILGLGKIDCLALYFWTEGVSCKALFQVSTQKYDYVQFCIYLVCILLRNCAREWWSVSYLLERS